MSSVKKSIEITDAKIRFVSLVDRAANRKPFLLTKQEEDGQGFETTGRILKVDVERHYVTGIVYEPMVADAHDNFMTEAEIEKAAHWFMKNGDKIDLQHSFEEADGLTVVESSVTKADQEIEGVRVMKGTWLMTVEIANDEVWKAIENGEITGLSMGGVGRYAEEDVDLDAVSKADDDSVPAKLNLLERIARVMGVENAVVKGEMRDRWEQRVRADGFWKAFDCLMEVLRHWDSWEQKDVYEQDEDIVRDALEDFSQIIEELLTGEGIARALHEARAGEIEAGEAEVEKSGRKMSRANKERLNSIAQQLIDFTKEFDDEEPETRPEDEDEDSNEEETDMTREDIQKMIDEAVARAVQPEAQPEPVEKAEETAAAEPAEQPEAPSPDALTAEAVGKMLEGFVPEIVEKAVAAARDEMTRAFKQHSLPTSLDDGADKPVEKTDEHYLHGIL